MSEVKVTREHRLAALQILGWTDPSGVESWLDVGGDSVTRTNKYVGQWISSMVEESAVALGVAQTEHRIRAAVIADLRGLLERAYKGDYVNRTLVVDADSIELLIETLEAQNA